LAVREARRSSRTALHATDDIILLPAPASKGARPRRRCRCVGVQGLDFGSVLLIAAEVSPRAFRAWPLAWPLPSGPLGRQRSPALKGGSWRSFLRSG
jgi:hypothetical protein